MRHAAAALLLGLWPLGARAAAVHVVVEPVSLGVERLDSTYEESDGVRSRTAARLGAGAALAWGERVAFGVACGEAASTTDFGLLAAPAVRLERRDVEVELRLRPPFAFHAWSLQGAVGGGRRALTYHPDTMRIDVEGGAIAVDLRPVHSWTRSVAAELLHPIPSGDLVLRATWRAYDLDVSSPEGTHRRGMRDLELGVRLRVVPF